MDWPTHVRHSISSYTAGASSQSVHTHASAKRHSHALHECVHAMIHQLHLVHIYGKYGHHRRYLHVAQSNSIGRWAVGGSDKMVHVHFKIASFVKTATLRRLRPRRKINRAQCCASMWVKVREKGVGLWVHAQTPRTPWGAMSSVSRLATVQRHVSGQHAAVARSSPALTRCSASVEVKDALLHVCNCCCCMCACSNVCE
jgi:hypothetical protein